MDASMPVAKLRWLSHHAPEVHSRARSFLACKDWIRHRLTGDLLTDPVDACGTSLYDIERATWAPELVKLSGVRADQLPAVCDPCHIAGHLLPNTARELGLRAAVPVVVGAGDDVEVLGNGLMSSGRSLEHLGTTGSILACSETAVRDPQMAVELYPHVVPGLWVLGGSVTAAGSALAWAERTLGAADASLNDWFSGPRLDRPLVFLPHLLGQRCPEWNPRARGAWVGLSMAHTVGDLKRAVYEGVVFSLKRVLDRLEALIGRQRSISVCGGRQPGDESLIQRASMYGRPLELLPTPEPTALGAMIVAAVGIGLYESVPAAVDAVAGAGEAIHPDAVLAEKYARLYEIYRAAEATIPSIEGVHKLEGGELAR
jgi:xylulokinase